MPLGLDKLTDDQLFNLCQEMCGELSLRDPYIRRCAQAEIVTAAERLKIHREALTEAMEKTRKAYVNGIKKDILREVSRLVDKGEIKLMEAKEEAVVITQADREAKAALLEKLQRAAGSGLMPHSLTVHLSGRRITVDMGSFHLEVTTNFKAKDALAMVEQLIGPMV